MKKLTKLGKLLSKQEQKRIVGGDYGDGSASCAWNCIGSCTISEGPCAGVTGSCYINSHTFTCNCGVLC